MSHTVVEELCIGCGGCEYACPTGALVKTDTFLGLFAIDPFTCNDCGECVPKCPEAAIVVDPDWAVCLERGCPLGSRRLSGIECAFWLQRCDGCGTTLWREREPEVAGAEHGRTEVAALTDPSGWTCPKCGLGMKVACPRTRKLGAPTPVTLVTSSAPASP